MIGFTPELCKKKKRLHRNAAPFKIQYPMKNQDESRQLLPGRKRKNTCSYLITFFCPECLPEFEGSNSYV
jgi:hypothetical protein